MLYFNSLQDYAKKEKINWRTAKRHLADGLIFKFTFKKKQVFIKWNDIIAFCLERVKK